MGIYNHEHYKTSSYISTTSFNMELDGVNKIKLHSLSIPINYINITIEAPFANQTFYYTPIAFITIPTGCYSL